jgi:DNA-binding NtrC family response regulator
VYFAATLVKPGRDLSRLLGNPFAVAADEWSAAVASMQSVDLRGELERCTSADEAERLMLAYGHARACRSERADAIFPAIAARKTLPRPVAAYLRVAAAAGRTFRALASIAGSSAAMARVRRDTWAACFGDSLVHALALGSLIHDHDVLILGETGTGKDHIARVIQTATPGGDDGGEAPSGTLNAAAVPATLVESELFGYVKGAFTGAGETRVGRIRSAHGGCFFLDEVGDLDLTTQVKLLRVIETNDVSPLGSDRTHIANCRYVAATHKDLQAMAAEGRFRVDLYQRLAGNVLRLPPLRERPEDVAVIGRAFIDAHLPEGVLPRTRERAIRWTESSAARRYAWPGNVRELQNALRNLLLGLDPAHHAIASPRAESDVPRPIRDGDATMKDVQRWYLELTLGKSGGNVAEAARRMAVDPTTLRRWLSR